MSRVVNTVGSGIDYCAGVCSRRTYERIKYCILPLFAQFLIYHLGSNLQGIMSAFSGPLHFSLALMYSINQGINMRFCNLAGIDST